MAQLANQLTDFLGFGNKKDEKDVKTKFDRLDAALKELKKSLNEVNVASDLCADAVTQDVVNQPLQITSQPAFGTPSMSSSELRTLNSAGGRKSRRGGRKSRRGGRKSRRGGRKSHRGGRKSRRGGRKSRRGGRKSRRGGKH